MGFCNCLGVLTFATALVATTLPVWFFVKVLMCFAKCCGTHCLGIVHAWTKAMLSWAWWLTIKLCCCFFSLRFEGNREMNDSLASFWGKPRLIMTNHSSFMDAIATNAALSGKNAVNVKTLASSHIFNIPFLGGLAEGAGHFPVNFKSHKTEEATVEGGGSVADFSVDKDAIAKVMKEYEDWVMNGHIGTWAPEGRLNPTPETVSQFRAGGFQVAVHIDCQIWCICYAGFEVFWHRKAAVGGAPANCRGTCFKLCDSSHTLIKELSNNDLRMDEKQKCILLANHAQALFQTKRDELSADPWVSKLPGSKDKDIALVEQGS